MPDGRSAQVIDLETATPAGKRDLRLWLRLLTCANMIQGEVRSRLRAEFDLTLPQFDLLAQLDKAPAEGLTMGALGNRMMVSAGNITGITDRLERSGHVVRVRSDHDRRSQNVMMTETGRHYFRKVAQAHESWIAAMFEDMTQTGKSDLFARLAMLKQSVHNHRSEDMANE